MQSVPAEPSQISAPFEGWWRISGKAFDTFQTLCACVALCTEVI